MFIYLLSIDFYITKFILLSMSESISYEKIKRDKVPTVYVIQEIPGTREGRPKINIMGASQYGTFKFLLPELSQIIFSPGPLIMKLRQGLKNYGPKDYLLLTGDPAIIGVACSIVSDITNGKYNVLKWDKQERRYYSIEINLYEKGNIDE
tara:strand:+ start:1268 stop:1717 length:450 start_codon:yes stop_codon:yes gene_type:complete